MGYLENLFNMSGKVAIITGGSGVLGSKMAEGLLKVGVKVVILGTNEEKLQGKIKFLSTISNDIMGFKCNVLEESDIKNVKEKVLNNYKHIDILINAAGGHVSGAVMGIDQNIFDYKIKDFEKVTELNLYGTVLPTMIFGKSMAEQRSGSIINISSMATQRAITRAVGYSAAKAAIENFTRWMAVELAHKFGNNLRVNAIAPGFFLTEQNKKILKNEDGLLTERGKTIINITPFKRFGVPEELIGTVLWLASDASNFVTGTIIPVDGGFNAFSGV
jgi:NAD(P)-dependent dehydrogenase (short-subunit alcohol dehydrogenase family)